MFLQEHFPHHKGVAIAFPAAGRRHPFVGKDDGVFL
jgi:hypothetical protein